MLEGGGSRGQQSADEQADTEDKLAKFRQQNRRAGELSQRAHLVAFPLFLFGLLLLFSHSLQLSLAACALIPLALGLLLFAGTLLMERLLAQEDRSAVVQQHGQTRDDARQTMQRGEREARVGRHGE